MNAETDEAAASRRRSRQRAVGRTPDEHAALEAALARRRQRRQQGKDRTARTATARQQAEVDRSEQIRQERARHQRDRERQREREREAEAAAAKIERARIAADRKRTPVTIGWAEASRIVEQERRRNLGDRRRAVDVSAYDEEEEQEDEELQRLGGFDRAVRRLRNRETTGTAKLPPPPRTPGSGAPRQLPYGRKVRGAGWHRRGYRDLGCMWVNVRDGSYGHTRGQDVDENETLARFVRGVFHMWWGSSYPAGWYPDLFFRKQSLIQFLVELENQGYEEDEVLVRDYFDGGETVYFKVYDAAGRQRDMYA
ncbi:hypothetical protein SLS62_002420 [Diatrype stigma]|uniref:Uncharacterized protein n=1 Tax=Diatrype stigma TaxID=117547 RepID=A0AAN9UUF3_9PEZI